jgi:hypothetical protein
MAGTATFFCSWRGCGKKQGKQFWALYALRFASVLEKKRNALNLAPCRTEPSGGLCGHSRKRPGPILVVNFIARISFLVFLHINEKMTYEANREKKGGDDNSRGEGEKKGAGRVF